MPGGMRRQVIGGTLVVGVMSAVWKPRQVRQRFKVPMLRSLPFETAIIERYKKQESIECILSVAGGKGTKYSSARNI